MIDVDCIEEYLKLVDFNILDEKYFTIVKCIKTKNFHRNS